MTVCIDPFYVKTLRQIDPKAIALGMLLLLGGRKAEKRYKARKDNQLVLLFFYAL